MSSPSMADLKAILAARAATKSPLPKEVKSKLADRAEWSRIAGVCPGCEEEVVRDKHGVLRSILITTGIGGKGSPRCIGEGPHSLDPRRTYYAGRRIKI